MAPKSNSKSKTKENPALTSPYQFKPGTHVEISSDDEGFRGSWYTGTVIRRLSSKITPNRYLVEYHKLFKDDAGKVPLKELLDFGQLRPLAPREKGRVFNFGDEVDAFYNDGWWEGNVVEVRPEDGKLGVFFRSTKEKIFFGNEDLRLHREWFNGKWDPPLPEEEIQEKVVPTTELKPTEAAAEKEKFDVGMLVEVSSDEEGFEGAWFTATIVKMVKEGSYIVQYQNLRMDDDTDFLKEEVDSQHIRPVPPETIMVDRFKLLEEVDAMYNDCWWVGVIARVNVDSKYMVYFRDTDEELVFKHSDLRPHQDWINGKWVMASKVLNL